MPHNILVVDDEPDLEALITQRFRKRIRSSELAFQFAGNGEEALAKLQADPSLDVMFTDINMPVMDGLTLLSRVREEHPLLRSVIASAYGDMPNIRTALNRGAFDFVTKPFDFEDLEITLNKAIGESVLRKQAAQDRDHLLGIHRELDLARNIQESLVPRTFPSDARFEVFGCMVPAAQVGGDLFDFFMLDQHKIGFTVGDVSGKGFPASLFMAVSRTVLRVAAGKGLAPHECLMEVNRFLCEDKSTALFLTCFYGIIDLATGTLDYSSAAHNPPYVVRANSNQVETLDASGGLPLALFGTAEYQTASLTLEPGDTIVVFTDGISEAMNANFDQYEEERVVALLQQQTSSVTVQQVVERVIAGAHAFADGAPQSDDMTVLGVRYLGKG